MTYRTLDQWEKGGVFTRTNSDEVTTHYNRPSQSAFTLIRQTRKKTAGQRNVASEYDILLIKVRARVRIKVDEEPKYNNFRAVPKPEMSSYN